MDNLRLYLNNLSVADQAAFAARCGTSLGYLRKAISVGRGVGAELAIALERESGGSLRCEELCVGPDWSYIRGSEVAV